jgi:hypothetical protein
MARFQPLRGWLISGVPAGRKWQPLLAAIQTKKTNFSLDWFPSGFGLGKGAANASG